MDQSAAFLERCVCFSAEILILVERLPDTRTGRHVADQLMRSGTSVGANVQEARSGESRKDFVHKMGVALKEIRETNYWLILTERSKMANESPLIPLLKECDELTAIIAKSVITAKKNAGL